MAFPMAREWQSEQLEVFKQRRQPIWVTHAGTGTGKTVATCFLIKNCLERHRDAIVIVLCPLNEIRVSWEKTLEFDREDTDAPAFNLSVAENTADLSDNPAYVTTYAGMSSAVRDAVQIQRRPVILVLDEFHRLEESDAEQGWCQEVISFYESCNVVNLICLTATPWREGSGALPFVQYDEHGKVIADFVWDYSQELAQDPSGVVEVAFRGYHAKCDKNSAETRQKIATLSTEDMQPYSPERNNIQFGLTGFVRAKSWADFQNQKLFKQMLDDAHTALMGKRQVYKIAKGLIICESIETAKVIHEYVSRLDPEAVLVSSKHKGSAKAISDFRKSTAAWCVSVAMVAEGVDIKPIKVIVDLSNVLTLRDIIQRWGRALRKCKGASMNALVFHIHHAMLDFVAEHIKEQISRAKSEKREGGGGDGECSESVYDNHESKRDGAVCDGHSFDEKIADLADWMAHVKYHQGIRPYDYSDYLKLAELIFTGFTNGDNPLPEDYEPNQIKTENVSSKQTNKQKKAEQRDLTSVAVNALARTMYGHMEPGERNTKVNQQIKLSLMKRNYRAGTEDYKKARVKEVLRLCEFHGVDASALARTVYGE